jgi:DNA-binding response OmpR family regulator
MTRSPADLPRTSFHDTREPRPSPTILVVHLGATTEATSVLRAKGWRILEAASTEEGLALLDRHAVDLVVLSGITDEASATANPLLRRAEPPVVLVVDGPRASVVAARMLDEGAAGCIRGTENPYVFAARCLAVIRRSR